jgi:DNA-binding NarL/FixJ family response regulator
VRVLVVDDHEVVRYGVVGSVSSLPFARVVAVAASGAEAVSIAAQARPDAAIVDMRLPDMSGEQVCRQLLAINPRLSVVMLTSYLSHEAVRLAQSAGAAAYVTKGAGIGRLKETLAALHANPGMRLADESTSSIVHRLDQAVSVAMEHPVTPHQRRVLELAAAGLTNGQIGERINISESTVRFHIQKLKRLLDAPTRTALIVKAMQGGAILPEEDHTAPPAVRAPQA